MNRKFTAVFLLILFSFLTFTLTSKEVVSAAPNKTTDYSCKALAGWYLEDVEQIRSTIQDLYSIYGQDADQVETLKNFERNLKESPNYPSLKGIVGAINNMYENGFVTKELKVIVKPILQNMNEQLVSAGKREKHWKRKNTGEWTCSDRPCKFQYGDGVCLIGHVCATKVSKMDNPPSCD